MFVVVVYIGSPDQTLLSMLHDPEMGESPCAQRAVCDRKATLEGGNEVYGDKYLCSALLRAFVYFSIKLISVLGIFDCIFRQNV